MDGLKKPSKKLKNQSWLHLSRRKYIRYCKNVASFELSEKEQKNYEYDESRAKEDPWFDRLEAKYDLTKLDAAMATYYK